VSNDMPVAVAPILAGQDAIVKAIEALAESNRGENPAPGLFRITATNRTHIRMRVTKWVVAADVAAGGGTKVQLMVGTSVVATIDLSGESPSFVVPVPITIERGTDVSTAPTSVLDALDESYLIYYPT
jgi:hypothetical protein